MELQNNEAQSMPSGDHPGRMTACLACQKQKVRCSMDNGQPPCRRCSKRHVACVFKRKGPAPSQGTDLRAAIVHDLMILHSAVNELYAASSRRPLDPLRSLTPMLQTSATPDTPTPSQAPETYHLETDMFDEPSRNMSGVEGLNQAPIASLYQITRLRSLRSKRLPILLNGTNTPVHKPKDIISTRIINWADADRLTRAYLDKQDHYLYGVACKFKDLESIRSASSLLLAAICTVSALHDPAGQSLYLVCNVELRRLISNFVFAAQVNLEDFRALCIACFWLSDISWPVSGLAIRRALEFELQKSCYLVAKASASDASATAADETIGTAAIEGVRLWYLFYICDQHLSILYGRSSTIREQDSIGDLEAYLRAVQNTNTDIRIVSQVTLLLVLNKVSKLFGTNMESQIPTLFKPQLDQFIDELDQWVTTWLSRCQNHPQIGDFPSKAVTLHYYFAKLYVCSHVFRGVTYDAIMDPIPAPFRDTAMMALESARSVVNLIIQDPDLRMAFIGMPHYYHTMIAFACTFLLKIATKFCRQVAVDVNAVSDMINHVVDLCKSSQCAPYHLVHRMSEGLQLLLSSCMKATSERDRRQRQNELEEFDSHETPRVMQNSSSQQNEQGNPSSIPRNQGTIWDTALEAATLHPGNCSTSLYDYPYSTLDNSEWVDSMDNGLPGMESLNGTFDASLSTFDIEHMGLRLL